MARNLFTSEGAPCLKCHMTGDAEARCPCHGSQLHGGQGAAEAGLDQAVDAGPGADESGDGHAERACSGMDNGHYVFTGPTPPSFNGYHKDHADLLVRYMFQFTPEELGAFAQQRRRGQN